GEARGEMDVPLGPAIGQCCGGRVEVALERVGPELAGALAQRAGGEESRRPAVLVFGAGHVGHALAQVLSLLPVRASVIDTRPEALAGLPEGVEAKATPVPEAMVRSAPEGAAYAILTHDHALDFLIAYEAL